jgi:hypothetical protein
MMAVIFHLMLDYQHEIVSVGGPTVTMVTEIAKTGCLSLHQIHPIYQMVQDEGGKEAAVV